MKNRWHFLIAIFALAMTVAASASGQSPAPLAVSSGISVGTSPAGIDFVYAPRSGFLGSTLAAVAVVANSQGNSVSLMGLSGAAPYTISAVPSPYAVAGCSSLDTARALVSSPTDNAVQWIAAGAGGDIISGSVAATIPVGSQPYSVACALGLGVVSNVGDSTLTVINLNKLTVTATISGVPGSQGFHGIAIFQPSSTSLLAWVAGTNANVVTVVDLINFKVIAQIPVAQPTAIVSTSGLLYVASAGNNNVAAYDPNTLEAQSVASVPNPQDLLFSPLLGDFVISSGATPAQNSIWGLNGAAAGLVASIPGAAALAVPNFVPDTPSPRCCAQLLVTSATTNSVYLLQQSAMPAQFGVTNNASYAGSVSPGSLGSAFGPTGVTGNYFAASVPLPTALGGVALSIGGSMNFSVPAGWTYSATRAVQAPLLFVGPNQINFEIPAGVSTGNAVPAQLTRPDGTTLLTTISIASAAPGIFTVSANGQGQGAVVNQDDTPNGNSQSMTGAEPAMPGSVIQIYGTGINSTSPFLTIGGQQAQVQFSGMAPGFVGLWQINAVVPQSVTPGNAVPLVISAGGAASNTVTIAVQ